MTLIAAQRLSCKSPTTYGGRTGLTRGQGRGNVTRFVPSSGYPHTTTGYSGTRNIDWGKLASRLVIFLLDTNGEVTRPARTTVTPQTDDFQYSHTTADQSLTSRWSGESWRHTSHITRVSVSGGKGKNTDTEHKIKFTTVC